MIACWILGSYMFPLFTFYPILHLQGVRESGKSTLLEVIRKLAWNPTGREVALREADLFRTIEGSRVTYLADVTTMRAKQPGIIDVIDVYETGSEQGGSVRRCDPETHEPRDYKTYSPKAIATREEVPFEAKCLRIITQQAEERVYTKRRVELLHDPEFPTMIGDIIHCCLQVSRRVLEAYDSMEQTDKLMGRRFDYWRPILAVCKVFSPGRFDKLLKLAEEDAERQEAGDLMTEVEDCVISILLKEQGGSVAKLLKDLTKEVQDRISWVKSWHPVKSAIRNLGVAKQSYQTGQGVTYRFDLELVRRIAKKRGIRLEEALGEEAEGKSGEGGELRYGNCEVCGKPGARGYYRDGRWIYLHDECREDYMGDL